MRKLTLTFKTGALLCLLMFLLSGCNPIENDTTSATLLTLEGLQGLDMNNNQVTFVQSDVAIYDSDTGTYSVGADTAVATLRASLLSPITVDSSQYNDIQLDRYVVTYTRSDNKNVVGVDVPYPINGNLAAFVKVGSTSEVPFVIVREAAKLEPPLYALRQLTGDMVITCRAQVDIYGHDVASKKVKVTGYIDIYFGNYADK